MILSKKLNSKIIIMITGSLGRRDMLAADICLLGGALTALNCVWVERSRFWCTVEAFFRAHRGGKLLFADA